MKTIEGAFKILMVVLFLIFQFTACSSDSSTSKQVENGEVELSYASDYYFQLPDTIDEIYESEEFDFHVQNVVEGVEVVWGMAFLPNGNMIFTERDGDMHLVRNGELVDDPIGGVPEVWAEGQGGLLDVEPHPQYDENGWLYFSYSKPGDGGANTAIVRARYDEESHSLIDLEELYSATPSTDRGQHFGSRIKFDNQGYMFFSIGDRGNRDVNPQDINRDGGKIYRLHDDGTVPEDNPFVGSEGIDAAYTYGVRNPQGMDLHPETGIIWTNEHGPRGGDEINVHKEGGINFGWPEISYGINYNGTSFTDDTARAGMEQPIWYWDPSIAPSGMAFVTSDNYPGWKGDILNGALAFQLISRIVVDGEEFVKEERILEGIGRIRDVEQAPDGYIYFSNESNGSISRILPVE
ncbi:PQQ-dependent sugar dehydrogenase [Rhodohalobacter sulfatireducens]|uniref:PQQ-dependent sugar dehydrogenase n=1 Tax=Rhodohalobacter sulfatireducens TaxID=2911366 RepID=A0ABS9KJ71_9BACT|nr:PQQ-dependent sugar dehydrogenase [Rhodohalobacter sulfatireducens]MCG2590871.1 PQQ-dependent sugar dehydrogenase [Rhodohalobacter sulfatireducens]